MSLASIAVRTSNVTISNANQEIRTTAAVKARVLELSLIQATGTAQSQGLGRPAAQGVTPGTTSTFQRDDSADSACVTTTSLTWGTSPTAPANYYRRWNSAATVGVGIVWTFPRGLILPVSASTNPPTWAYKATWTPTAEGTYIRKWASTTMDGRDYGTIAVTAEP